MTGNPPGFHYHTGLPAIVVPNEPPDRLLIAARQYGASYLILDENRPPPLADLYAGVVVMTEIKLLGQFDSEFKLYQISESP